MPMTPAASPLVAILAYHKIGEPPADGWYTWSYVPTEVFEQQLAYLAANDWTVIDLPTLLRGLDAPETLPARAALITFDDGYRNNLTEALPVLQRFGYPAVIFVPTGLVGGYNAFDADIQYEPKEDLCTWDELRELARNGVAVESHSVGHPHFSELDADKQIAEIRQSSESLAANLGQPATMFSFPYGDEGPDPAHTEQLLIEAGYQAACLYLGGPFRASQASRYHLSRVPIGPDTDMRAVLEEVPAAG
jgi:peptidoglycan/xylan/chitin deacetylase (PgdA/CDA1 family)